MSRRSSRLVGPAGGLRVNLPAERLSGDGTGLSVFQPAPQRMVEDGEGLLVTEPAALTAAAGDEEDRSPDPWEEQRLQAAADLVRWERKLEASTRKALAAWTAIVATAVLEDRYLTAAPGDGDGQLPPDPNAIPPLAGTWSRIANAHIVRTIGELLGEVFARFLRDDEVVSARPWQDAYLETVSNRLSSVADSTFDLVRDVVRAGIDEGASIPTIRDAVQESLDAGGEVSWANRARTIARTETIGAYNGGHLAAWDVLEEETEDELEKVWLATIDPRTRDSHFRADGQRVPLGDPFRVGGHDLAHPGDPTAPPGEVINCRCTMLLLEAGEPTPDTSERGFRDADDVAAEIARRAEQDPPVVRAYDDPEASLQAAAATGSLRPDEGFVARMDAIFRASYADPDPLLADDSAQVDPALVASILEAALVAAGLGGLAHGDAYDPNQKRDENGKWTKHGVGISIKVKGGADEQGSFAAPTEALARATWEHDDLRGSDGKTYRSEITKFEFTGSASGTFGGPPGIKVRGVILGPKGFAGEFVRYVRPNADGPEIYHGELRFNEEHRGLGLGSEFNRRAEDVYRAAGAVKVTLDAMSRPDTGYVGGYVWARRGFGWADTDSPKKVAGQLRAQVAISKRPAPAAVADAIARLEAGDLAAMPTPFEVSELRLPQEHIDYRIGKRTLLQQSWNGVRWLPQDEDAGDAPPAGPPVAGAKADDALDALARRAAPTTAEFDALDDYVQSSAYRSINAHLRGLGPDAVDEFGKKIKPFTDEHALAIPHLRALADKHQLDQPVEVWRGMQNVRALLGENPVGAVITDPGFMSTSTDRRIASSFAGGLFAEDDAALLRITVPPGHPAVPVDQVLGSADPDYDTDDVDTLDREYELLLPPGSSVRVTAVEKDPRSGRKILVAEVLPYGSAAATEAATKATPKKRAPQAAAGARRPAVPDDLVVGAVVFKGNGKVPYRIWGVRTDDDGTPTQVGLVKTTTATDPTRGTWWNVDELTVQPAAAEATPAPEPVRAPLTEDDALVSASALVEKPLTGAEHSALRAYTGLGYGEMNRYLRGTGTIPEGAREQVLGDIDALRAVADRHRLTEPIVVMRGQQRANDVIPGGAAGAIITDPGFMSTTTDRGVANGFAGVRLSESAVLELTVPAGHPVLPVDALYKGGLERGDSHIGEWEIALPPGSAFRVTGERRDDKGRRIITAEVLEYQGEEAKAAAAAGTVTGLAEKLTVPQLEALDWFVSGDFYGDDPMPDEAIVAGLKARGLLEPISATGPAWKLMLTPKGHEALDTGLALPAPDAPAAFDPDADLDGDPHAALFDGALAGVDALAGVSAVVDREPADDVGMALVTYTGQAYQQINPFLRGVFGDPDQLERDGELERGLANVIGQLRELASEHELPANVEAWRGITEVGDVFPEGATVGRVLTDPAFMSVTTDRLVAAGQFTVDGSEPAVLRMLVPQGHPFIPVDRLLAGERFDPSGVAGGEQELILPPGASMRIVGDSVDADGLRVLTAEVLPYDAAAAVGAPPLAATVDAPDAAVPDADAPAASARTFKQLGTPLEGDEFLRATFDPKALTKPEKEALGYWTNGSNYRQVNELLRTGSVELKVMTDRGEFRPAANGGLEPVRKPTYKTATVRSTAEIRALAAEADGGAAQAPSLTRLADQIDNLPAAIDRHQLPEDMSLFRVAALPELAHADPASLVGRTITDRGFVATSTSEVSAVLVTHEALGVAAADSVLFEIRTPAGTPFATPEIKLGTVNGQKLGGYTRVQEVLLHPSSFRVVEVRDEELSTSGYSLKNGALVSKDAKAKRPATKVRRVVVELVDPDEAPPVSTPEPDAPAAPVDPAALALAPAPIADLAAVRPNLSLAVATRTPEGGTNRYSITAPDGTEVSFNYKRDDVAHVVLINADDRPDWIASGGSSGWWVALKTTSADAAFKKADSWSGASSLNRVVVATVGEPAEPTPAAPDVPDAAPVVSPASEFEPIKMSPRLRDEVAYAAEVVETDGLDPGFVITDNGRLQVTDPDRALYVLEGQRTIAEDNAEYETGEAKRKARDNEARLAKLMGEIRAADPDAAPRLRQLPTDDVADPASYFGTANLLPVADEAPATPAVPEPATVAAPDAPPIKLTAARVGALEYYAVPLAERTGKAPNYSVYMPLLKAGLIERDANGKYVATDAGRDAIADAPTVPAGAEVGEPGLAPDLPADVPPLAGEAAYASLPKAADLGHLSALARYQGAGYDNTNYALRTPGEELLPNDADLVDALDAAFAEPGAVLGHPITVMRGAQKASAFLPDQMEPGTVLVDPGFMSTSTDPGVVDRFILFGGDDSAIFNITVPAGGRVLQVTGPEAGEAEREALLPRGSQLRVTDDRVERHVVNPAVYEQHVKQGRSAGLSDDEIEANARQRQLVMMVRRVDAEVVLAEDRRDATPGRAAEAAPAASRPAAAPDSPADSAQDGDGAAAAIAAEREAAEKKAAKRAAAAAKKAEKKRAAEEAARAADLAQRNDSGGVPMKLTYEYLSSLSDEEREDVEVHLIEGMVAGDPMAESRLEDLTLFNQGQAVEDELASQEDRLGVAGVSQEIAAWHERNGRPGLTHPLVGGDGATGDVLGVPSMKQVREEYRQFIHEQWLAAEEATRGSMITKRGERLGKRGIDMFSSHRGVADVMQYASEELLEWFETNRRIAWAEFYYERTRASGYAAKAAAAKAVSLDINRDRTALKASAGAPALVAAPAVRKAPAAAAAPTEAQLDAYAAGRAAAVEGLPATDCPFAPDADRKDSEGLFVLWVRGYLAGQSAAFTARRVAEGLLPDPALDRLGWDGGDVLVLPPAPQGDDPAGRLLAVEGDLVVGVAGALTASARPSGHTVTAAGSGPGDSSATEGRPPMPRTWVSAPHLAPFGVPTGDGRIFKVGSLTARELPLPLLFQPSSGMGHDGSVVVGRILKVSFTDVGIVASGDYLDADPEKAPDLAKAIEQAVALTESGLGHVSVDLSDVVGELVDEDGNPVSMEDIFDSWEDEDSEDIKVLEQISEGKLIACTQVATPAFEGAKIELSAAPVDVDAEAALTDEAGATIAVGAIVDVETDEGTVRGEVTAVDEDAETVSVQPTDEEGEPAGDPLEVAPAAITVVTPVASEADSEEEAEVSLIAAAGPLRPPAAWFEDPKLPGPTAMTITDDGRIYGHVAVWGACHVGFSNTCVTPPTSPSSYKHFHVGEVVCEDGTRVAVGNLTLGGRHADVRLAYRSAIEHYDVSGAGVAVVRCYEDEFGIAFAGALAPGTTEEQVYDMRRSPVSGDWRRVGGELEMIGVLSVNAGGFNTPRFATDEAGRTALVAAPSVRPMDEEAIVAAAGGGRKGSLSQAELIARITRDATAAVRRELAEDSARIERARRLRGLATAIKADPKSRLQRLAAVVEAPKREARKGRLAELSNLVGSR